MDAFRNSHDLAEYLNIEPKPAEFIDEQEVEFPTLVPREFANRMEKENAKDPLLLQVMPCSKESETTEGYTSDPLGEKAATISPGLLHKYHGRALLIATGACPIHCRYCFRRHFPYSESIAFGANLNQAIEYLEGDRGISEVILSGGDPLMLNNSTLETVIRRLEQVDHLQRLRIHSRMPVALPSRIDCGLTNLLKTSRFSPVLVIHCNHPNELDQEVCDRLNDLHIAGVTILNQSVLLRDINDKAETLGLLSEKLISCRVLPYYLHLLDQVDGAAHFAVGASEAVAIYKQLQKSLPGYLVPRMVHEKAGAKSKLPLLC
jgi:EF-P beta-lysylation protein EpmB